MYPVTGYFPFENKICVRCHRPTTNPLQSLCDNCRDADVLMDAARAIRDEMKFIHPVQEAKAEYCLELAVTAQERAQSEPHLKDTLEANAAFYMMEARKYLSGQYQYTGARK